MLEFPSQLSGCEAHREREVTCGKPLTMEQPGSSQIQRVQEGLESFPVIDKILGIFSQEGWGHLQDTEAKEESPGGQSRPILQGWALFGNQMLCYVLYMDGAVPQIQVHMPC